MRALRAIQSALDPNHLNGRLKRTVHLDRGISDPAVAKLRYFFYIPKLCRKSFEISPNLYTYFAGWGI